MLLDVELDTASKIFGNGNFCRAGKSIKFPLASFLGPDTAIQVIMEAYHDFRALRTDGSQNCSLKIGNSVAPQLMGCCLGAGDDDRLCKSAAEGEGNRIRRLGHGVGPVRQEESIVLAHVIMNNFDHL